MDGWYERVMIDRIREWRRGGVVLLYPRRKSDDERKQADKGRNTKKTERFF